MNIAVGVGVWVAEILILAATSARPFGAWMGVVFASILLPLPVFVSAPPLVRCLLACFLGATLVRALDLAARSPMAGFLQRLAHLCAYFDTRQVQRRSPRWDWSALRSAFAAAGMLALCIAVVKRTPAEGSWLPLRWLAGGVGLLALAEAAGACHQILTLALGVHVPPLFCAPYLSKSVAEFWSRRWNVAGSEALRHYFFAPFARHPVVGLFATFAASAAGHMLIAGIAMRNRPLAVACGAFFLIQPFLIMIERHIGVRRWRPAGRIMWTAAALGISSPLVVEPILRIAERAWGEPNEVAHPTAAAVGFCATIGLFAALAGRACMSREFSESYEP